MGDVTTPPVDARSGAPVSEIDLTQSDDWATGDLLGRVTLALASTLELREVLRRLARIGREATGARHCSLFLLEGRDLVPTVAIGERPEETTWQAFRSMGTVPVDASRWNDLVVGKPIAVPDAMGSDLIPVRWRKRFVPGAVVLVPLMADGAPCGLLAVDWPAPRDFEAHELGVLDAIGTAAGVAVRNARLFEETQQRARLQEALTRGAATLASSFDATEIAEQLVEAFSDLIGAHLCAIGLLDAERACITTVASRGPKEFEGPIPLAEIPNRVVDRSRKAWEEAKVPIEFFDEPWFHDHLGGREAGAGWYLLSPLVVEGHTRGCVLLGFEQDRKLDVDERLAIRALAGTASAAVERAVLIDRRDRRMRRLDVLYRVSAALTDGADADTMVVTLGELLSGHGVEVDSVAFRDDRVARRLGAPVLSARERAAATGRRAWDDDVPDAAVIPMYLGRRLYGVLRVRPADLDSEERAFLETLARDLAEVAHRDQQRARLEEAARERVITTERDRMACDLHDTAGQVFVAMGLLARAHLERLGDDNPSWRIVERVAELADRGKFEIDHAARALAFVPATRRGLVPSLKSLVRDVERDSGIRMTITVSGEVERLAPVVERGLYRVAHEAIANAWRHAECTEMVVEVDFDVEAGDAPAADDVTLRVVDDGVGVSDDLVSGRGLEGMRRAMDECGGSVSVESVDSRGTVVRATAPRRKR